MTSDEHLVSASLAGDEAAFAELVSRYRERLYRFLLTRAVSRADADDALQDTFVNAYRYLATYNPRWRFSTWIYRIAIRCSSRGAPATVPTDEWVDEKSDPLAECIAHSARENLWLTAKETLTADAYTALWLRYAEDLTIKEVARSMERSQPWVKVTLMRARKRLQSAMSVDDESDKGEVYG